MTKAQWKLIAAIHLLTIVIVLSPFLPGPSFLSNVTNGLFSWIQLLSFLGLFLIPIGIIWTIRQEKKKKQPNKKVLPILFWTFPAITFVISFWGANIARDFSRNFAIARADKIITAVEQYKQDNNKYPNSLHDLIPNYLNTFPEPWVMGIPGYNYERKANNYRLGFSQNVLIGFNFEVVEYNPSNDQQVEGELKERYDTGRKHWKYYIYD
ncbi:hypothetical protein HRG84_00310 [Flavisolibacter sp. BT320]|nr:hypothetical protein [Flavisolibacter longurius]